MSAQVITIGTTDEEPRKQIWHRLAQSDELARRLEEERLAAYLALRGR